MGIDGCSPGMTDRSNISISENVTRKNSRNDCTGKYLKTEITLDQPTHAKAEDLKIKLAKLKGLFSQVNKVPSLYGESSVGGTDREFK